MVKVANCTAMVSTLIVTVASLRLETTVSRQGWLGRRPLRELDQPIHTEYNKRKPQQPKRHANLRRFANRVYPGQFAGAFESAECNRKTLHGHQSPRRSHYHPSSRINQRGQRNQRKVNHLLPHRQIRRDFPTVLPPSPQEIFEKRVTLVRHGYPEWLGYSILSVYRYWESALERDSSRPDEQVFGLSDVGFRLARNPFVEKSANGRSDGQVAA